MKELWQNRAAEDLDFAYKMICENHPGPVDKLNKGFVPLMERALRAAQRKLPRVKSREDYQKLLCNFADTFDDKHLRFAFPPFKKRKKAFKREWYVEREGDVAWVRFPSFYYRSPAELRKIESTIKQARSLRDCRAIIFDVRGNGGGSSRWGEDLLAAVYGRGFVNSVGARLFKKTYSEWRVSERTLAYFKLHRDIYRPKTIKIMEAACRKGLILTSPRKVPHASPRDFRSHAMSSARPIFLTDGVCFSATLDFLDIGKRLPRALQVGQTTGADTLYLDVYSVKTPHGAFFQFPWKVYRNRPRASNEPYVPDIVYRGDMKDEKALRTWVAQKVVNTF
jgi:hypothetical protein